MHPFKKFLLSILIILVLISIFQDLSNINNNQLTQKANVQTQQSDYNIIPIKVMPGDTVLSIIEGLHQGRTNEIKTDLLLKEFRSLNPTTEPTDIRVDHIYYFPLEQE
ncbi:hypothetical protein ACFQ4N_07740 [Oceanobacillus iheyensis]|uniref:LysM domain-containing protein n=1 Tax=Oceanobacillus iheyensis (strain DSM 14371 / CIP 107618 / JCM 11309 / KCTC 3954 / HTE831) TaxID=221109 RepID=Q8EPZ5_OCEIH|nr:hypothetical protein [Oceanobacillus iheyensis]BAC13891.1 hypothetical protein [Oceanobacillus iheyensis HTE831]